jgi:hypothetical protein
LTNVVSFPEFKISDILDNPIQPRGFAEKFVLPIKKVLVSQGFACKNVLPTNVSVKKGIC